MKVEVDMVNACKSVRCHLTVTRTKEVGLRFWIAAQLIRLAAWIMPASVTVNFPS